MADSTTLRSRALGNALRKARVAKRPGLSLRKFAAELDIRYASLSEWETGKKVPQPEEVARILTVLGVSNEEYARVIELARDAHKPNWLAVGIPGASLQLAGAIECEEKASVITEWAPLLFPGLLQTRDYARAVIAGGTLPPSDAETLVHVRLGRRDVLTRQNPARLEALLGETAIRDCIGDKTIMANQLRHLLEMSARDNVVIRVVPSGIGWHPGLLGPFTLYDFDEHPSTVGLEHHRSGTFLADDGDVSDYGIVVDTLRSRAMDPDESTRLISEVLDKLDTP